MTIRGVGDIFFSMDVRFAEEASGQKWLTFVTVGLCIAAVGVSAHFFELRRREREKRIAAENELKDLTWKVRLLEGKNRELAEQLREAKRIAEQLAREKESVRLAAGQVSSTTEPVREKGVTEQPPLRPREATSVAGSGKSFRLEKLSLAAKRASESAGELLRRITEAVPATAHVGQAGPSPLSPQASAGTKAKRALPGAMFARAASRVMNSAEKGFTDARSLLSSVGGAITASVSPTPLPPSESPRKLTATDEELRKELEEVRREKRELEREIAERTGNIQGAVNVGHVRITTGRRFSGKVLVVNRKYDFVVIDIGKEQGLETGEVLIVHRGSKFIGKAQVVKVYEKMAAADLVMDWMQEDVQVSDGVKKF